ncbi:MAG: acyl-CoA dehydrogenase [Caulobacteraceae bacterium]|nr:acyl-CoA dehydrogenase [Caulobacteraceae bacterium]
MGLRLTDEQQLLRDQVRGLLSEICRPDDLRRLIASGAPWDERLWKALAELGVLGAAIPEQYGGVGLGPVEVSIVAQELGRAVAPVPFFSSICLAAEALMLAGTDAQRRTWLPKLASGEAVGTLAWTEGKTAPSAALLQAKLEGGRLFGVKTPVPDAEVAQICVVACLVAGKPGLALAELGQPGVRATPLRGIDELRRFSRLDFDGAAAEPMDAMDGADALRRLLDRAAVYEAFEQVGGAEAALTMARDFTLQRHIFGRPLASYQAIKHSLANIFAKLELATCNALYAVQALQDERPDAAAAAATARIGAASVYDVVARENLQFHGGIGFTWEADCHFHYRRARTLALNIGSPEFWSDRLIEALDAAPDEQPRASRPARNEAAADSPEDAAYREKVRAWIAGHGAPFRGPAEANGMHTEEGARRCEGWTRLKHAAGYSGIDHPKEFGGAGGTRREAQIFAQEEAKAGIWGHLGGASFPMAMAALRRHGTPEQRRKWESATYAGEIFWCQLFSEPGAGSDLAAVRTKAVKQGDHWVVNGQKVWTSGGDLADYGILLARTDPSVSKHQGLSFFLIDMRQPGVTVRPIRQINGGAGFTETFLVDAVVPDENRIDAEGQGWAVAMSVLAQERTTTRGIGEGERRQSSTSARSLIARARQARREKGVALDSALVRAKIAGFHVEAQGIKNFTLRLQEELARGGPPPTNLPVIKLTATNRIQQLQAFLMDLDEAGGLVDEAEAADGFDRFYEYMTSPSARIAGGADQVLLNQLAERALGMPGDPRADRDVPFSALPA